MTPPASTPSATPVPYECTGGYLVSFDFDHGTILAEQYAGDGIHIAGDGQGGRPDAVIVFDSAETGTPDSDLEIDEGKFAVLPENVNDADTDGLVDEPNDSSVGGKQIYTFDQDRDVAYVVLVDMDRRALHEIRTYDADDNEISTITVPQGSDGELQVIQVNDAGVRRLEIVYDDSGGVVEICLDQQRAER